MAAGKAELQTPYPGEHLLYMQHPSLDCQLNFDISKHACSAQCTYFPASVYSNSDGFVKRSLCIITICVLLASFDCTQCVCYAIALLLPSELYAEGSNVSSAERICVCRLQCISPRQRCVVIEQLPCVSWQARAGNHLSAAH